jgi:hypothetical protein
VCPAFDSSSVKFIGLGDQRLAIGLNLVGVTRRASWSTSEEGFGTERFCAGAEAASANTTAANTTRQEALNNS